jgi:hypothetical protein
VPGTAAVHYTLRHVHAVTHDIRGFPDIHRVEHGPLMHAHAQPDVPSVVLYRPGNLDSALDGRRHGSQEHESDAIAGGQRDNKVMPIGVAVRDYLNPRLRS